MSTADPLPRAGPAEPAERGFTVLEMMVVIVVVAIMTLAVERTISSVTETERTMRAIRNTTERGQRAAYALRDAVSASRKLFGNDAVGSGYLAKLDLTAQPIFPGSRLPKFAETEPLGPDSAGTPMTGNVLLFVREADPYPCTAVPATKTTRVIDAYRFVCVYLTQSNRAVVALGPLALDLVEWRSDAFPSYGQVMGIADTTQRKAVVADLYNRFGCDFLWDSTGAVNSAFYGIDGSGTVAGSPTAVANIPEDLNVASGPRFVKANMAVSRTDPLSKPRTPVFTADDPATWTPNGFEVKVVGPSGSRQVWMRLCIEQQASAGRVPAQDTTVIVSARDL